MMQRIWRLYVNAANARERALRILHPGRLRFVTHGWPLRPGVCPCDVDFVGWLAEREIRGRSIFHLGTGAHHLVGVENHARGWQNEVFGLTLAPSEHRSYLRALIREPGLGRHYKVLFADLYSLCAASLPGFEAATLFHLAEVVDPASPARRLDDAAVFDLVRGRVATGGHLLFYRGSFGFARVVPLIEVALKKGSLAHVEDFRSLAVYRVPEPTNRGST
jgi:hypothetical protein